MSSPNNNKGCGCANIPISLLLVMLGAGYWGWTQVSKNFDLGKLTATLPAPVRQLVPLVQSTSNAAPTASPQPSSSAASPFPKPSAGAPSPASSPRATSTPTPAATAQTKQVAWNQKAIRGIYLSRYQVTNNADEKTIRDRVRYYRQQGINTIIHGVWGNGCTMYRSAVMKQNFGYDSCPNQFQDQWLNWLIDEAHKQGMQVHAYFEKGIKLDENSPIFDLAVNKRWIVPGVDKTYAGIDHYVLDVEIPEVSNFFRSILVEFVTKYPNIDAVQWDDYLGYYAGLPGKVDRTDRLTKFVRQMRADMKKANPKVSFDLCHHNPYWGKRYFAADWQNWQVDRVFIQTYNDANFQAELAYAKQYAGVALTEKQLYHLPALVKDPAIKGILIFPFSGKPEQAIAMVQKFVPIR